MGKRLSKLEFESMEQKENDAIEFICDEIDLVLPHTHKYRARFDMIHEQFLKSKALPDKYKTMLLKIYEIITDLGFGSIDQ